MYKLAMFDFNGTLIDDAKILHIRTVAVFKKFGVRPPSFKKFRDAAPLNLEWYYSNGIPRRIDSEDIRNSFNALEDPSWNRSKLRPDALDVIKTLRKRNIISGIVSALNTPLFERRMRQMRLRQNFDFLIGGQENKTKAFLEMIEKFNVEPKESFYIGDTASDMGDAARAGIVKIAFSRGYNSPKLLLAAKPDFMVKSFSELLRII